jgi:hypothetical protein
VEWTILLLCMAERLRIPDQGSAGRVVWKEFRGELNSVNLFLCGSADVGRNYSFKSFRFLLTDSRVPRDTKRLVAGVAAKKLAVSFLVLPALLSSKRSDHDDITGARGRRTHLRLDPKHQQRGPPCSWRPRTTTGRVTFCSCGTHHREPCSPRFPWRLSSRTRSYSHASLCGTISLEHQVDGRRWWWLCCYAYPGRWASYSVKLSIVC